MTEVAGICSDLLRIDTTNDGTPDGSGERTAAEYVAGLLAEAGIEPMVLESAPRRTSVVARVPGDDPEALLIHGHLDVVPADPAEWRLHPFSGEIEGGCVNGRGAVDMKGTLSMTLTLVREWARTGRRPRRDLVLAFLADEEATGEYGAGYAVTRHRDLFEGCTEAISESGGFSVQAGADGGRVYPVAVGERGTAWMKLTAHGVAGHGSKPPVDNPVAELCRALARLADHRWPVRLTPAVARLIDDLGRALGTTIDLDRLDEEAERLGKAGTLFRGVIRNSANPTMLNAGYKVNVIPGTAEAHVDGRFLPGFRDEFLETLDRLLGPKITREFVSFEDGVASPTEGLFDDLCAALLAEDPAGRPVPYVMTGGTDAKSFARLGIRGYGFAPLLLDPSLDYFGMFHGVDERVPVAGLEFGVRVLDRLLASPATPRPAT
ncbi:peptidase M20 [Sphaerisporangium krabiense]|uniref:Acetylornithine deacetylase/succinyl-diaminopimelate desuccinylase-like protein n=1 Tax=Sphaerisporangium krabiense TaxID=763782 RepID=A0A7W8Z933_9ACTN|nr:M20/M25/M40 family metallo-hydrolase [Sphaerisporangium krabiense]MBB5629606.1 acetylornithine deacetylase/succinyl-diaminopimelate desuccinylase-like protein [Sphaerisporangium krabiense]GII67265.1 peptidase M20 [Sphaerisporangium krabiense]